MEVLERIYRIVGGGEEYGIHRYGASEIEELYRIRGTGDLDVEEGEIAMTQAKGMEMRETVEELVVEVDLFCAGKGGTLANDVVKRAAVDVLEDHADVLEAAQEGGDVAMAR